MNLVNIITEIFAKLKDGAGNAITSTDLGSGKRGLDVNATVSVFDVRLRDASNPSNLATVDSSGRVYVYMAPSDRSIPIQLLYENSASLAITKDQWQDVLSYTVPNGYDFNAIEFSASSSQSLDDFRVAQRIIFGTFATGTRVYTDGSAYTVPQFASRISLYVTNLIGNADSNIYITYTNQSGVSGRVTSTLKLPKNSVVGTRLEFTLQTGDFGIIDVTGVTSSAGQISGNIQIEGTIDLVYLTAQTVNVEQLIIFSVNSLVVSENNTFVLQFRSSAGTGGADTKIRRENFIGALLLR